MKVSASTTPRHFALARKPRSTSQYLEEGAIVCKIEQLSALQIDIALDEQDVARVRPGQRIEIKARALPYSTFTTQVDRVAPVTKTLAHSESEEPANNAPAPISNRQVMVYGQLDNPPEELLPGMTGYARVTCGRESVGALLAEKALKYVRTEFWW